MQNVKAVGEPLEEDILADAGQFPDQMVLLAGHFSGPLPGRLDVRFTRHPGDPAGLVAVLPGADVDALFRHLAAVGRLQVPIADFSGHVLPRAEFRADNLDETTLEQALAATQRIRRSIRFLPFMPRKGDRDLLSVLTLAVTRETAIEAVWAPGEAGLVGYPLLAGLPRPRRLLEQLAHAGLVSRRFFERLPLCGQCGSARLAAREVCVGCGSAHLREETLVHHYRCGHQGPRSHFEEENSLICPKCSRLLRHYGVEYDTPGDLQVCRECNAVSAEPEVAFVCTDCGRETPGDDVRTADWFHYDLTSAGEMFVAEGRLPNLGLEGFLKGVEALRAPRDLALMIDSADRLNRRYDRPFTIVLIHFSFSEGMHVANQTRAERLVVDVICGVLRETDLIAALEDQLVLFLPETAPASAQVVIERINEYLAKAIGAGWEVRAEVVAESKVPGLIDLLTRG